MDKFLWGASQGVTSALFFSVQLTFLKSSDLKLMALFSCLFAIMNLLLLVIRRSLIEINDFDEKIPGLGFVLKMSFIFFFACSPFLILIHNRVSILIYVSVFFLNQIILDFLRFTNKISHAIFIAVQFASLMLTLFLMVKNLNSEISFGIVVACQLIVSFMCAVRERRKKLNFNATFKLFSFKRFVDFVVGSGYGFFLPSLVFVFLDARSVGELRTSQNFLSLGSIFTSAVYYSTLGSKNTKVSSKAVYLVPSLTLFATLIIFNYFVPSGIVYQIFGPYFYDSLTLTVFLILSLVPTIWVSQKSALLVKAKEFNSLLRLHIISLATTVIISSCGFLVFGIYSYGITILFVSIFEVFLLNKLLRKSF
jgi:hypothetical protein